LILGYERSAWADQGHFRDDRPSDGDPAEYRKRKGATDTNVRWAPSTPRTVSPSARSDCAALPAAVRTL